MCYILTSMTYSYYLTALKTNFKGYLTFMSNQYTKNVSSKSFINNKTYSPLRDTLNLKYSQTAEKISKHN